MIGKRAGALLLTLFLITSFEIATANTHITVFADVQSQIAQCAKFYVNSNQMRSLIFDFEFVLNTIDILRSFLALLVAIIIAIRLVKKNVFKRQL